MEENKNFYPVPEEEIKQLEERKEWFCDDFEASFRERIPKHRALSVYRLKRKRTVIFWKSAADRKQRIK